MTATVRVKRRGPLVLEGDFKVVDHEGKELLASAPGERVALCRCGASRACPRCDGSHNRVGFEPPDGDQGP